MRGRHLNKSYFRIKERMVVFHSRKITLREWWLQYLTKHLEQLPTNPLATIQDNNQDNPISLTVALKLRQKKKQANFWKTTRTLSERKNKQVQPTRIRIIKIISYLKTISFWRGSTPIRAAHLMPISHFIMSKSNFTNYHPNTFIGNLADRGHSQTWENRMG